MTERPKEMKGITHRKKTGCGNMYVTINKTDDGKVLEVFARLGRAGGCASSQTEALGRLISCALKHDIPIEAITKQLSGIRCQNPVGQDDQLVGSCSDAIAQVLSKYEEPK